MFQNRLAIASPSLGQHATHTLPQKIVAAAEAGIRGLEITHSDLVGYAKTSSISTLEAARRIRRQCEDDRLEILAFAPFKKFEGQRTPLPDRLQKAREWLAIAHILGAEHFQVPSNHDRTANGDHNVVISEFQELSDLAATFSPVIKIAYENLGWGTHCETWQQALKIAEDVDRPNFGLCLDSFHFCVALWGDAFNSTGIKPDGDRNLKESLRDLIAKLPLDKLFYLQLSDGERLGSPYSERHPWYDPELEPGHVWSNEARPFPLETQYGGYMPVLEVTQAFLVDLGYTGWVSLETFDRRMRSEDQTPVLNARRAVKSWEILRSSLRASNRVPSKL